MAVENVNNALSKFEADKSLLDKLDDSEKNELSNVEKDDCQGAMQNLDNTEVAPGVKLGDVMKSFNHNTRVVNGKTVYDAYLTINDKQTLITKGSDLGALVQMYIYAHGGDIGNAGIDGRIGRDSVNGAKHVLNNPNDKGGNNGDRGVEGSLDRGADTRLFVIFGADYRYRVGKYSDTKYGLLSTKKDATEGSLKNQPKILDNDKVEIKYTSAVNNKEQKIKVDASTCKKGNDYSPDLFGKAIEKAITEREQQIQDDVDAANRAKEEEQARKAENKEIAAGNEVIKEGINDFTPTNEIVKEYVKDKKIKIKVKKIEGDKVYFSFGDKSYSLPRKNLLTRDRTFNSDSFNKSLNATKGIMEGARQYVAAKLDNDIKNIGNPATLSTVDQIRNVKTICENFKKEIVNKYGNTEFDKQKNDLQKLIEEADAKIGNKEKVNAMNKVRGQISGLCRQLNAPLFSWNGSLDLKSVISNMKNYVNISQDLDGYTISAKQDVKSVYEAAKNAHLYVSDMEDLRKALSNYSHQTVKLQS